MPTKCELLEIGIMHGKRLVTNQKAVRARRALRWQIFKVKWLCTLRKAQKKGMKRAEDMTGRTVHGMYWRVGGGSLTILQNALYATVREY